MVLWLRLVDAWPELMDILVLPLAGLALSLWAIGTMPAFADAISRACGAG